MTLARALFSSEKKEPKVFVKLIREMVAKSGKRQETDGKFSNLKIFDVLRNRAFSRVFSLFMSGLKTSETDCNET